FLPGDAFIIVELMINLYYSVIFGFMTPASQWTSLAVLCLVLFGGLFKACGCFLFITAYTIHLLAYRAVVTILFFIIMLRFNCKWMFIIKIIRLLFVEVIIFYKAFN